MFERIRRKERREPTVRPEDLPEKVVFEEIDYEGEHLDLAVPIEAKVELNESGDVVVFNDDVHIRSTCPTLEEAERNFCGSFLFCYRILQEGVPGIDDLWLQVMNHVGDNTVQKKVRPSHDPSECQTVR